VPATPAAALTFDSPCWQAYYPVKSMLTRTHTARIVPLALISFVLLCMVSPAAFALGMAKKHHRQHWKEQITALEQQWRTAMMTNDLPMLDKLLSDDYVGISMSGQISTKTMQMDRMRSTNLNITKLDLSGVQIKLLGRVAIVTSLADVVGTNDGKPIEGHFRYTRVYQRVGSGGWKTTNFEATRLTDPHGKQECPGNRGRLSEAKPVEQLSGLYGSRRVLRSADADRLPRVTIYASLLEASKSDQERI
jgi:ketosteroid isomerase-like protein